MFYTTKKIELNNYDTNYINMNAIIQHSKNLVLYYGFNSGIILMKASNSDDMFWIDFEDFQRVKDHTWSVDNGYIKARINMQLVRLHRFVKNARDDILIDHKTETSLIIENQTCVNVIMHKIYTIVVKILIIRLALRASILMH
jgi:hypothetical protein